jgi:hypothetical protein
MLASQGIFIGFPVPFPLTDVPSQRCKAGYVFPGHHLCVLLGLLIHTLSDVLELEKTGKETKAGCLIAGRKTIHGWVGESPFLSSVKRTTYRQGS